MYPRVALIAFTCAAFLVAPSQTFTLLAFSSLQSFPTTRPRCNPFFAYHKVNALHVLTQESLESVFNEDNRRNVISKISYEDIQQIIDVSHPYYKLENGHEIRMNCDAARKIYSASSSSSDFLPFGFISTVSSEMPIGRETGSLISASEAGRHMAISGSVAAARNNVELGNKGKHYYLALDCKMKQVQGIHENFFQNNTYLSDIISNLKKFADASDQIVMFSVCCMLTRKNAVCKILMQFPESYCDKNKKQPPCYFLDVKYSIMTPKLFKRISHKQDGNLSVKMKQNGEDIHRNVCTSSPYASFRGLPLHSILIHKRDNDCTIIESHLPIVQKESCQGHFDGYPALPIALLGSFCNDLCIQAIGNHIDIDFKFDIEPASPSRRVNTNNVLQFSSSKVSAKKLVFADTHGINLRCQVKEVLDTTSKNRVFFSKVTILSSAALGKDNEKEADVVGTMELVSVYLRALSL